MNERKFLKAIIADSIESPPSQTFDQKVMQRIKQYAISPSSAAGSLTSKLSALLWAIAAMVLMLNSFFIIKPYIKSIDENALVELFSDILTAPQALNLFAVSIAISVLLLLDRILTGRIKSHP